MDGDVCKLVDKCLEKLLYRHFYQIVLLISQAVADESGIHRFCFVVKIVSHLLIIGPFEEGDLHIEMVV